MGAALQAVAPAVVVVHVARQAAVVAVAETQARSPCRRDRLLDRVARNDVPGSLARGGRGARDVRARRPLSKLRADLTRI